MLSAAARRIHRSAHLTNLVKSNLIKNRYQTTKTIATEPITDPQGGLAKELFYDDVRASPFNAETTIHDSDVLRIKLEEAERTHLIASRKRMHQPLQMFQDFHQQRLEAEAEAEMDAETVA